MLECSLGWGVLRDEIRLSVLHYLSGLLEGWSC